MPEDVRNIYKAARRTAGYTQETAAEMLNVSVESIRAYETGRRVPPGDVVEQMVICYNAQRLALQHLQATNRLLSRIIPRLEERSVMEVAIRIYNCLRRFQDENRLDQLMSIAEDGIIDENEQQEFNAIVRDLRKIIKSGLELEIFCGDGRP